MNTPITLDDMIQRTKETKTIHVGKAKIGENDKGVIAIVPIVKDHSKPDDIDTVVLAFSDEDAKLMADKLVASANAEFTGWALEKPGTSEDN